jgi:hypothetical protein
MCTKIDTNTKNQGSLHPSERDYSHITSSDQKYCASIFNRGWKLKTQSLYSQYKWFEQFERNIITKINSKHKNEMNRLHEGLYGKIPVGNSKISVNYGIIDYKLYLTVSGEEAEEFYKRGTKFGFEYGTVNQAGVTIRSRKLQSWGFLDFIRIDKQSPHTHRIFVVDLVLYEDYKNQVNYIVNEKKTWIQYKLNKRKNEKPLTWTIENRPSDWVRQLVRMKNQTIKNFFFHEIVPLQGSLNSIEKYRKQQEYNFIDSVHNADECLDIALNKGIMGSKNKSILKTIVNQRKRGISTTYYDNFSLVECINYSDSYLALRGMKRIEPDNENKGAARIFKQRMELTLKKDTQLSPLVRYGILSKYQCSECKIELNWGIGEWSGFSRSDIFAPDIVITNGEKELKRKVYAIIQVKGQSRTSSKHHPTSLFYQLLELKRYELNAGIKTAMVVIKTNPSKKSVDYYWLLFRMGNEDSSLSCYVGSWNTIDRWIKALNEFPLDPIFPRNARSRELGREIFELILTRKLHIEDIQNEALNKIKERIINADKRFAEFNGSESVQTRIGVSRFVEIIDQYLESIEKLIFNLLVHTRLKKINNYPIFQSNWNNQIYKHYFNSLCQFFGLDHRFRLLEVRSGKKRKS